MMIVIEVTLQVLRALLIAQMVLAVFSLISPSAQFMLLEVLFS
jgi:hypothetical protein